MMTMATKGQIGEITYTWPKPGSREPVQKLTYYTKVGDLAVLQVRLSAYKLSALFDRLPVVRAREAIEMIRLVHLIPDDVWDRAAEIVLREIRAETGIPNWLPKLLNGRDEFEKRVEALVQCSQQP